jgi:hypothetical protein
VGDHNQTRKPRKPRNDGVKVGDAVRYVLSPEHDPVERVGTVQLLEGRHCVVELKDGGLVWITLSAS